MEQDIEPRSEFGESRHSHRTILSIGTAVAVLALVGGMLVFRRHERPQQIRAADDPVTTTTAPTTTDPAPPDLDLQTAQRATIGVANCMKEKGYDYVEQLPPTAQDGQTFLDDANDIIGRYYEGLDDTRRSGYRDALGNLSTPGCAADEITQSVDANESTMAEAQAEATRLQSATAFKQAESAWRRCLADNGVAGATSIDQLPALIDRHREVALGSLTPPESPPKLGENSTDYEKDLSAKQAALREAIARQDAWEANTRDLSNRCSTSSGYDRQIASVKSAVAVKMRQLHPDAPNAPGERPTR